MRLRDLVTAILFAAQVVARAATAGAQTEWAGRWGPQRLEGVVQRYLPRLFGSKRSDGVLLLTLAGVRKLNIYFNRQGVLL